MVYVFCMFSVCSVYVLCMFSVYVVHVFCMLLVCLVHALRVFVGVCLHALFMHPFYVFGVLCVGVGMCWLLLIWFVNVLRTYLPQVFFFAAGFFLAAGTVSLLYALLSLLQALLSLPCAFVVCVFCTCGVYVLRVCLFVLIICFAHVCGMLCVCFW